MNSSTTPENRTEGLKGRVLLGMIWTNLGQILQIVLQLIALVVLARLLTPHDFGVFTIALIIIGITESVFWPCLEQAIVQYKGSVEKHVDVAWTGNLMCVLAGCFLVFLLTPVVTHYVFNVPEATSVTWLMLICVLCPALRSPRMMLAQRNIQLLKVVYVTSSFTILRYMGAIAIALWLQSYWALALAYIAGRIAEVVLSYVLLWYRPRLEFNLEKAKELYQFSSWLQAGSILKILSRHLDSIVIGSVMNTTMLGLYNRAWTISAIPLQGLEVIVYRVFFPMFSAVQGTVVDTEKQAKRAIDYCLLMWTPIFVVFAVAGEPIVSMVLGDKWLPIATVIPMLVAGLAVRSLVLVLLSILRANSLSREAFILNLIPVAVVALSIIPLVMTYGLIGAAIAVTFGAFVALIATTWVLGRLLSLSVATSLLSVFVCCLTAVSAVYATTILVGVFPVLGDYMLLTLVTSGAMLVLVLGAIQMIFRIGPLDTLIATLNQLRQTIENRKNGITA